MIIRTRTLAAAIACTALVPAAAATGLGTAIITTDQAALRAAPRDSARQQALLWQGEVVEVRGERMDYLQVYDHARERGGFVRASHVRRTTLTAEEAPELLSILRFLRDTPGAEALGIGFAMAAIQATPAERLRGQAGIDALDALGTLADRLARRASSGAEPPKAVAAKLSAHLDVATRHGIRFSTHEYAGRMQICYDGDAFRRVLAMQATPEQRARAALALTRTECVDPDLGPTERSRIDEWRAEVLDRVDASELSPYLMNRVHVRRASVWSSIAYHRARHGELTDAAARRALAEFASVQKSELADVDGPEYNDAAIRVSVSRRAAVHATPAAAPTATYLSYESRQPGETCLVLMDARRTVSAALAKRCTFGIVWAGSATLSREGNTLAVAVQPADGWLELWVFWRAGSGWTIRVLPSAVAISGIGYVEFAGWVPGGTQMLVAREARVDGRYARSFEVLRLDTLAVARQAGDPGMLAAFQRWQDASWKSETLSVR